MFVYLRHLYSCHIYRDGLSTAPWAVSDRCRPYSRTDSGTESQPGGQHMWHCYDTASSDRSSLSARTVSRRS